MSHKALKIGIMMSIWLIVGYFVYWTIELVNIDYPNQSLPADMVSYGLIVSLGVVISGLFSLAIHSLFETK
jgi:hypothetical protein